MPAFPGQAVVRARVAAVAAMIALALGTASRADVLQSAPQFRAAVDLIAVDVQVVDGKGQPMTALDRDKFEVSIDGRKRRVASVDLIQATSADLTPGARPIVAGPSATNLWPAGEGAARTFMLAVDSGSFEPGDALPVMQAARAFVTGLAASDRVGLFTLPPFSIKIDPTIDRTPIRQGIDRIAGQRQSIGGQYNLSTSEILDIAAETSRLGAPLSAATQTAAANAARGIPMPITSETDTLQRVQVRECRRAADPGCIESIISEAALLAQHLEERAIASVNGLTSLLEALRLYPGRKTVVLLSGGLAVSDRPGARVDIGNEARQLGEQAAHANATIYAVHVDGGLSRSYSAQSRRARDSVSLAREQRIASKLLDEFAGASGGALLTSVVGNGEIALDRVLRETSAYYLIGVEPADLDRDGRAHRLQVKVDAKGATVRSRQWVVLRAKGY